MTSPVTTRPGPPAPLRLLGGLALLVTTAAAPLSASTPSTYDALVARATSSMMVDPEASFPIIDQARREAGRLRPGADRTVAMAAVERLRAEAYIRLNRSDDAGPVIAAAMSSIQAIARPLQVRGDLLLSRGAIHSIRAEVAPALADYQHAFGIFRKLKEPRSQAIALSSIAWIYREARDYPNALKYYAQSADAFQSDPALLVSIHNSRGTTFDELGRFDEGEAEFRVALAIARRLKSPMLESLILRNQARGLLKAGRGAEADRAITRGIALSQGVDAAVSRAQFLSIAAQSALQRNDLARARRFIDDSFAGVDLATTTVPLRAAHETAYEIYKRLDDTDAALHHLEALKRLDDQTTALAASTNTALMSARFDSANQEVRIANLKAEDSRRQLAYEKSQKRFQQTLFLGVTGATAILIALLTIGLVTLRRSRNRLAVSNAALKQALAAKTEFLATTSHEIRTPLNGILGMTQVMLADTTLAPAMRERIDVVHGAGVTMRALVDDLLDVAKMENGHATIEMAPVDLPALLGDVARMWQDQARARGLDFVLDVARAPARIEGDADRLKQIVFNLLSNAIKFTETGAVTLSASTREAAEGERLCIAVQDTGVGVAPHQHELIFESFRQADGGTTRKYGGTGLGLTICRNLARAMGGDVRVESAAAQGATFVLDLPLVRLETPASSAVAAGRVVVVDGNPISRAMLRAVLEKRTGNVGVAGSLAEVAALGDLAAGTTVLIDETALASSEDDAAIAGLLANGIRVALLAKALEEAAAAALVARGVLVIRKPIAGVALCNILLESSQTTSDSHLVSCAA